MEVEDVEQRKEQLKEFRSFIDRVDQDVTMILQSLQWDRSHLEGSPLIPCSYNRNHKIPSSKLEEHTKKCEIASLGYCKKDKFLPENFNKNTQSTVQLGPSDIENIITNATKEDPLFKKEAIADNPLEVRPLPLTVERLQSTYTADERRAIYDYVVKQTPQLQETIDLLDDESTAITDKTRPKSEIELKAQLRDIKRRRTKYKVATKSKNYSEVLREVIRNQMDVYSQVLTTNIKQEQNSDNEGMIEDSLRQRQSSHVGDRASKGKSIEREKKSRDIERKSYKKRHRSTDRRKSRDRSRKSMDRDKKLREREQYKCRDVYYERKKDKDRYYSHRHSTRDTSYEFSRYLKREASLERDEFCAGPSREYDDHYSKRSERHKDLKSDSSRRKREHRSRERNSYEITYIKQEPHPDDSI